MLNFKRVVTNASNGTLIKERAIGDEGDWERVFLYAPRGTRERERVKWNVKEGGLFDTIFTAPL